MSPRARVGLFGLFACIWFLCGAWRVSGADSPARGPTDESGSEPSPAIAPHLQEQQELFQQAIEQARREMEEAASRNADALSQRLDRLQQSLEEQQRRELEAVQNSNRTTLMFAALLAGAGFLCLFCLAFFLMRATNRLTEVALAVPLGHALGPVHPALTAGQPRLTIGNPAESVGASFRGAIEQLEKRLHDLEHTTQHAPLAAAGQPADEQSPAQAARSLTKPETESTSDKSPALEQAPEAGRAGLLALLLAKGQTLLNLDKADEALDSFEEVIAIDPRNAEALFKKGLALERLRRTEEALECYDQAIAVDGSLTAAYLHKGSVFNRLERYEEALRCYEQALQTEQKVME